MLQDETGAATRTISGTAIVFNSQSQLLNERGIPFKEIIKPEAITPELIANSDIKMLYNHKADLGVLARSKRGVGSLQIEITSTGVDFQFEAPKSPMGDNILESIKRGDLDACSFGFWTAEGGEKWLKTDTIYHRTVSGIRLLDDLSIVVNPAYTATSCNTRGLDELIESEETALRIAEAEAAEAQRLLDVEAAEKRQQELTAYYSSFKNIVESLSTKK